jgi:hypothetical protein
VLAVSSTTVLEPIENSMKRSIGDGAEHVARDTHHHSVTK